MKVSCLVTPLLAKLIEFEIWLVVLLRRLMMWNLMKPMVLKRKMRHSIGQCNEEDGYW
jgi:hypothetical protein